MCITCPLQTHPISDGMYTMSQDSIDLHFAQLLDIYKNFRVQTMSIQKNEKFQDFSVKTHLKRIRSQYTTKNCDVCGDFVLQQTKM